MFTCQADKLIWVTTSYSVVMFNMLRSDVVDVTLTQHTKTLASKVMESENLISVSTPALQRMVLGSRMCWERPLRDVTLA